MFRSAMGSEHCTRNGLISRCCNGASFGFGFVFTVLTLMTMFWIAWCYFGLTIVQISNTQRRAVVNYSYPSPTPTAPPVRSTISAAEETSINSISKSPTTIPILRGSSRGEMPLKVEKKKEPEVVSSFAKGDFASRDRDSQSTSGSREPSASSISSPRGPPRPSDEDASQTGHKAAILSGTASEDSEDRIYARRVLSPGAENRPEDSSESDNRRNPSNIQPDSRLDISPTKVYDEVKTGNSRRSPEPEVDRAVLDDGKTDRREYVDRDVAVPSRRDETPRSDVDPVRREADFDREYSKRYAPSAERERSRLDDEYDDRGSKSRYDRRDRDRDRDRDDDDRYLKGDTRVYSEDRPRERVRERYPEDSPRRGDDDRYRDDRVRSRDDRERSRDRDYVKPRERIPDDRTPVRDERYREDDRYIRTRDDDRYVPRDDDRYRSRGDDRYRDDEGYRSRDDDRYRDDDRKRPLSEDTYRDRKDDIYLPKDDDRYIARTDERDLPRDDDKYRSRDDDRYRTRDDDRYRSRGEDDRYNTRGASRDEDRYKSSSRPVDEKDRLRSRDDERYIESRTRDTIRDTVSRSSDLPPAGRSTRISESVRDYDVGGRDQSRDTLNPTRLSRPLPDDERYVEPDRRPPRYDDDDRRISPTRTRIDDTISRPSIVDPRPKDSPDDARYTERDRENRRRDNRYDDKDDRFRNTRIQGSRGTESSSNSRRVVNERDSYQTRLPSEGSERNENSREEVVLDRRSYASEEEYRRQNPRSDIEDRSRSPAENTRRRYKDDEKYVARDPADDRRIRDSYDYDKTRSRDRSEDVYDRPAVAKDDPPLRKYADEERERVRDPDLSTARKEEYDGRGRPRSEDRYYDRDAYSESRSSSRRTYADDDIYDDDRRRSRPREPSTGSSMTPTYFRDPDDVVTREKRFQNKQPSSRVISVDATDRDRDYSDTSSESRSRDVVRPLSAKDVIEAAMRHSDTGTSNSRNVYYPVFDPRVTNLTSTEIIRASERRGTTITARKRRSAQILRLLYLEP